MTIYVEFEVGGTIYRTDVEEIEVRSAIGDNNTSSDFRIRMRNDNGRYSTTFTIGNDIRIRADRDINPATTLLFRGIIEDIQFSGTPNVEILELSGRDYTARMMAATIEPSVFTNSEVSTIVTNIIDSYVSDVTRTNVDVTTTTLSRIQFLQTDVFDAIQQLAELSGFFFYVDTTRDLHFELIGSTSESTVLNTTNVLRSRISETNDELTNRVFVYGDRMLAGRRQTFTADGGSLFTLNGNPHNTFVLSSGLVQTGGVFEILSTAPTGVDYLVNFHDSQIIFVSGATIGNHIPVSNTSVQIDYDLSVPIAKFGRNSASVSNYGPYTKIIINKEIKDANAAEDVVESQLNLFSLPQRELFLELMGVFPLTAGNSIAVNLPFENINGESYTILEARYVFDKERNISEEVMSVRLSRRKRNVVDILKQIILDLKKQQASDISTTDVITRLEVATGSPNVRVRNWIVTAFEIERSFILGHGSNGVLGSPAPSVAGGSQVVLGDFRTSGVERSGGTFP